MECYNICILRSKNNWIQLAIYTNIGGYFSDCSFIAAYNASNSRDVDGLKWQLSPYDKFHNSLTQQDAYEIVSSTRGAFHQWYP